MSTFAQMRAEIADDLDDPNFTTQINKAINRAIVFYEKEKFYFNSTSGTFSTTASQKAYTTSTIPSDIAEIDYVEITVSGNDHELDEVTFAEIEEEDIGSTTGVPTKYAFYNESIYLYPIPNNTYTITVYYQKKYTTLSSDSDTNDWLTEAEDLIECHATGWIYARKKKDFEQAAVYQQLVETALQALRKKTEKLAALNARLRPTEF